MEDKQRQIAYEERRKIGYEIHDGIIRELFAVSLQLQSLCNQNDTAPSLKQTLMEINNQVGIAIQKSREIITQCTLEEISIRYIVTRLEKMVDALNKIQPIQLQINAEQIENIQSLPIELRDSTQLYYIIQEAITNVVKHSNGSMGWIDFSLTNDNLTVRIADNGSGRTMDKTSIYGKLGIRSMVERSEKIGASLKMITKSKQFEIILTYPLRKV